MRVRSLSIALACAALPLPALAQRADDNAVQSAEDAFGTKVGNENLGLYNPYDARGFSPVDAGNSRIDGLYFDQLADPPGSHVSSGTTMRIGIAAQNYPLPAPTGIADYAIRRPGKKPLVSLYGQLGYYYDQDFELDVQTPLTSTLGVTGGFTLANYDLSAGGPKQHFANLGLTAQWKPSPGIEIVPFVERAWGWDREAQPLIVVGGPWLPPRVGRRTYYGQDWTKGSFVEGNDGLLASVALTPRLGLRVGAFRSFLEPQKGFVDLFLNTDRQGMADHVIIADQDQRYASISGETRLAWEAGSRARPETLYLIVRGRDQQRRYGGSAVFDFGQAEIGVPETLAAPTPVFGPQSTDRVRTLTLALAWKGAPTRWLALGGGVQKAFYRKTTTLPGAATPITGSDQPWLFNASAAAALSRTVALYASFSTGLEEGGVAPDVAVNKGSAAPAIITRQLDGGVRLALSPTLKLIVGGFEVKKPYYSLDPGKVYRELGVIRQRGIEVSLAGNIGKDLRVVAGALLLDPRALGEEVTHGTIGALPVGVTRRTLIASADYTVRAVKGLSLNATLTSIASRVANPANTLFVPPRSVLDVGARLRTHIGHADATLSGKVGNLFNTFGWRSGGAAVFTTNDTTRWSLSIAADI